MPNVLACTGTSLNKTVDPVGDQSFSDCIVHVPRVVADLHFLSEMCNKCKELQGKKVERSGPKAVIKLLHVCPGRKAL